MSRQELVFYDIETTGLDPFTHEPFEFGLVVEGEDGTILEEDAFYFPPDLVRASPEAMKVNRYAERAAAYTPQLPRKVGRAYAAMRLNHVMKGRTAVVNALQFDLLFTSVFLEHYGQNNAPWSHRSVDLKSLTAGVLGVDPRDVTTGAVQRHFGLRNNAEHTAHGDALFNRDWFQALKLYRP